MLISAARRTAVISSAAALILGGVAVGSGSAAASAPSAKVKFITASLVSVAAVPDSATVWVLGTHESSPTSGGFYAMRHTGKTWTQVPISGPKGFAIENAQDNLAAGSAKSIWTVGFFEDGTTQEPLIEHSTGGGFSQMKVSLGGGVLTAVSASSADNAFVVGEKTNGTPLIAHWNGKKWSLINAKIAGKDVGFDVVSTSSPTNAWFVGAAGPASLITHWNGHSFTNTLQGGPSAPSLVSVATDSASNTWVVGDHVVGTGPEARTEAYTEHFNGKKWHQFSAPSLAPQTFPTSVSMAGTRVFLVGQGEQKSGATSAYANRFVGGKWRTETVKKVGKNSLFVAVSVSSKAAMAVGSWFESVGAVNSGVLAEDLVGSSWHQVVAPSLRRRR
jgi:hypothetical protein